MATSRTPCAISKRYHWARWKKDSAEVNETVPPEARWTRRGERPTGSNSISKSGRTRRVGGRDSKGNTAGGLRFTPGTGGCLPKWNSNSQTPEVTRWCTPRRRSTDRPTLREKLVYLGKRAPARAFVFGSGNRCTRASSFPSSPPPFVHPPQLGFD